MRNIVTYILVSLVWFASAQDQTPKEYIEKYKALAIVEMHRSGVPASITLAQGILESRSGNSRLAKYANNHFGIKCKGSWTGNVIYANDDAPDECFRAYESVLDSYEDHSNFLQRNWRYHPLFELELTDYKGWCHGLRKAGYATNKQYGTILISLIERYELNKFDTAPLPGNTGPNAALPPTVNGVPVKSVQEGETVNSIAEENFVKDRHIRKWNDLPKGTEVAAGEIVYLKPKRRRGSEAQHTVSKDENMRDISQKYGIKLKQLYKKNRMDYGTQPKAGEVLNMQKKRSSDDKVTLAEKDPEWKEDKKEFVNPHSLPKTIEVDTTKAGAINKKDLKNPDYHVVQKGDNIYRIAEKYRVFEEDLLIWNANLNPSTMSVGQKVYLSKAAAEAAGANVVVEKVKPKEPEKITEKKAKEIEKEIAVDGPVYHIVVKGETLYGITKRYGITAEQLKKWNGLESITIKIGQKLQVSE